LGRGGSAVTREDTMLAVKVAMQRVLAAVRPAAPPPIRIDELHRHDASRTAVDAFHSLWNSSEAAAAVNWQGYPVLKNPMDLWMYQELIVSSRPDVMIETGTHRGGSALFFADIAKLAGHAMDVITIDFNPKLAYDPAPHRIHPVRGISTAAATVAEVKAHLAGFAAGRSLKTMVVLDSDHSKQNVLEELRVYADLVSPGQWLVVEDTNVNGHPVLPSHGEGPYEAVTEFLAGKTEFDHDSSCERYLFTQNPRGWLRRRIA
jgi:cephalosporin hydroxylase